MVIYQAWMTLSRSSRRKPDTKKHMMNMPGLSNLGILSVCSVPSMTSAGWACGCVARSHLIGCL